MLKACSRCKACNGTFKACYVHVSTSLGDKHPDYPKVDFFSTFTKFASKWIPGMHGKTVTFAIILEEF